MCHPCVEIVSKWFNLNTKYQCVLHYCCHQSLRPRVHFLCLICWVSLKLKPEEYGLEAALCVKCLEMTLLWFGAIQIKIDWLICSVQKIGFHPWLDKSNKSENLNWKCNNKSCFLLKSCENMWWNVCVFHHILNNRDTFLNFNIWHALF